eukprot:1146047-Pelagomonas_calceolata.AAC.4
MQAFSRTPRRIASGGRRLGGSGQGLPKPVTQQPPLFQCPAAISAQADVATTSSHGSSSPLSTSSLRLPATHQESSRRALEQLKNNSVNRECRAAVAVSLCVRDTDSRCLAERCMLAAEHSLARTGRVGGERGEFRGASSSLRYTVSVSWGHQHISIRPARPACRLRHASQELHHQHRSDHPQHARGAAGKARCAGGRVASGHRRAVLLPAHRRGGRPVHLQPARAVCGGRFLAQRRQGGKSWPGSKKTCSVLAHTGSFHSVSFPHEPRRPLNEC